MTGCGSTLVHVSKLHDDARRCSKDFQQFWFVQGKKILNMRIFWGCIKKHFISFRIEMHKPS